MKKMKHFHTEVTFLIPKMEEHFFLSSKEKCFFHKSSNFIFPCVAGHICYA